MKNILLATDFSSNAHTAALFAGELCCQNGGRLIIFHALSPVSVPQNEDGSTEALKPEEAAQKKLDKLAYHLHSSFGISVSRLLKPGFGEDEIPLLAERLQVEQIIMGARGVSCSTEKGLGRVSSAVRKASCLPVICVPAEKPLNFLHQIKLILIQKQQLCNGSGQTLLTELSRRLGAEEPFSEEK